MGSRWKLEISDQDPAEVFQLIEKLGEGSFGVVHKGVL
jgi:hypothetical protein